MDFEKSIDEFIDFVNHPDFKKGEIDGISLNIDISSTYANIELWGYRKNLSSDRKSKILNCIDVLAQNKNLSPELIENKGYVKFVFACAALNLKHNKVPILDSFNKMGVSLPLTKDLLSFFSITRFFSLEIPNFHWHFKNTKDSINKVEIDSNSPEFLALKETMQKFKDNRNVISDYLMLMFDDSLKDELRKKFFNSKYSPRSNWHSQYLFSEIYSEKIEIDTLKGMSSVLGERWKRGFKNFNSDSAYSGFQEVNILPEIMPLILEHESFKETKMSFNELINHLMENFFQVNEKETLMFLSSVKRQEIKEKGMLLSNFLESNEYLRCWYLKTTTPSNEIEDVVDSSSMGKFKL